MTNHSINVPESNYPLAIQYFQGSCVYILLWGLCTITGLIAMLSVKRRGPFVASMIALFQLNCGSVIAQTPQEHVHGMSHSVMPFDMAKTTHIFRMTEAGGVQRVVLKDRSYTDQVGLIQHHLREEAERFQHGDYSDPAKLHRVTMPGLNELHLGARRVIVSYSDLPNGAEITITTKDPHLLTAIHRWFGAQLSEHGADAKAE